MKQINGYFNGIYTKQVDNKEYLVWGTFEVKPKNSGFLKADDCIYAMIYPAEIPSLISTQPYYIYLIEKNGVWQSCNVTANGFQPVDNPFANWLTDIISKAYEEQIRNPIEKRFVHNF